MFICVHLRLQYQRSSAVAVSAPIISIAIVDRFTNLRAFQVMRLHSIVTFHKGGRRAVAASTTGRPWNRRNRMRILVLLRAQLLAMRPIAQDIGASMLYALVDTQK